MMKIFNGKLIPLTIVTFSVVTMGLVLQSYSAGPAKDSNQTVTGAPFNSNQNCSKCHGGGNFGGSISLQLFDATNKSVTTYTPGTKYTFKISMAHTIGTPKYGFQTTAAFSSSNTNYNNWGILPSNTHNTTVSGRNYVEQSNTLISGDISIPWTAPISGSGAITFYTAGNLVNGTGGTSGDQPVNKSLTISEGTLPVSLLYFKGSIQNNSAVLNWATAQETNNKEFIIEKSLDGKTFSPVAYIPSKGNNSGNTYTWNDLNFQNIAFYRLKQNDLDGKTTEFNIIDLKAPNSSYYDITFYNHAGGKYILFYNGLKQQNAIVTYFDITGKILSTGKINANEGNNMYPVPTSANGVFIVSIITEDGIRTSRKFLVLNQLI